MKSKKKKTIKRCFRNLSVLQKMIFSLTVCVIVPIVVLGTIMTLRVLRLSEQNQYETQINQLTKSAKDMENLYTQTEQSAAALANENAVRAVIKGRATVMDYRYAAQKLKEASANIDGCSAVVISTKEGRILFQRGERYLSEEEGLPYVSEMQERGRITDWAGERMMTFQKGINLSERKQISYYMTVLQEVILEGEGILSVHIDVQELLEQFMPYQEGQDEVLLNLFLFNQDGQVMAGKEANERLEKLCWEKLGERETGRDHGYFSAKFDGDECIVLFTKCGTSGWYLFQVERKLGIYSTQITFVICAVLLCIMFGVVYGVIQNKTIIKPLKHLSKRMDVVKTGVMEKKYYETAHDEIGNVEKGFEDMVSHINDLINQVYVQTIKTKDAEREMLLAKMNPHFLYNALDSIHWLAFRHKDYEVSEQLEALADVYRHILQFGEGKITVEREMEFIENYLFLLECQMGDRVEFIRDVPEELYGYKIPKLLVQPLIENAVVHGLKDVQQDGKVKIRMRRRGEHFVITVLDNGRGCDAARVMELVEDENGQEAFALRNIHERVRLCFGEGYGLRIYSRRGFGCIAQVVVKLEAG